MIWMDFNIEQFGEHFTVRGDWPGEVWQDREGNPKQNPLYRPGDVFIVDDNGILRKQEDLTSMLIKYQADKN